MLFGFGVAVKFGGVIARVNQVFDRAAEVAAAFKVNASCVAICARLPK